MAENVIDIGRATEADVEGILALQAENQPEYGGTLSASFGHYLFVEMMREAPLIVARHTGRVIGYLVTSTQEQNVGIPIVEAMMTACSITADSYVYGPICVKAEERGKGLAQAMFAELQRLAPGRRYIFFVRGDNSASLRAHTKMGMHQVAHFIFRGNDYVVFSSSGSEPADRPL